MWYILRKQNPNVPSLSTIKSWKLPGAHDHKPNKVVWIYFWVSLDFILLIDISFRQKVACRFMQTFPQAPYQCSLGTQALRVDWPGFLFTQKCTPTRKSNANNRIFPESWHASGIYSNVHQGDVRGWYMEDWWKVPCTHGRVSCRATVRERFCVPWGWAAGAGSWQSDKITSGQISVICMCNCYQWIIYAYRLGVAQCIQPSTDC